MTARCYISQFLAGPARQIGKHRPGLMGGLALGCAVLIGTSFADSAPASANPVLSLGQPVLDQNGMRLSWSDAGSDLAYTVETENGFSGAVSWQPAPASIWPIPMRSWRDPLPVSGAVRFYRLRSSPAQAERGNLLGTSDLGTLAPAQIQAIYTQIGIPVPAGGGVRLFKLTYETVNPFAVRTIASGLVVVPQGSSKGWPLVSYQHGTIVARDEVPSAMQGLERVIGIAFGSGGYVAALPDYIGLGDSPGLHPFVHAKSEATAAVDLLRATRTFCASNAVALNGQLFLIGYSEGGHATMALHRELETYHTNEFTITASAPMAGPYDLSGVVLNDFLSGRAMPNPYYFLYLLGAYQSIYQVVASFAEILKSPYDRMLPPLLDGRHSGSDLNQAIGNAVPSQIVRPEFLDALRNNPNHPLRIALRENDLYDWTPKAPMRLYHCDGDQDVLFANSQVAYDSFQRRGATQVELINPYPSASHGDCAPIALLAAKFVWFDSLVVK